MSLSVPVNLNPVALAAFRQKEGLSQAALARKSGVSQGHISELESGDRVSITPKTANKLASALGVPAAAFTAIRVHEKALLAVEGATL